MPTPKPEPDTEPTRSVPPAAPDAGTGAFDPSAVPSHVARFEAKFAALGGLDSTRDGADPGATAAVSQIPGYELLGELGRGGMGVVYRARQVGLRREVALKTIPGADVSRVAVARFWAEAEVMAAVTHESVVQVFELGEHAGRPFMAMELVPGGSLADRLKDGPLPVADAVALVEKIALGVAAAHELGVVHRDLKPGNVLLTTDGLPKVTDFGLAKWRSGDLTRTQALMGTPAYMAPEQAAGRAKFVGPPADVWALGVVLSECLTGRRPFEGETAEVLLSRIQSAEPAALRTRLGSVPRDLDTIAAKCLAKEAEHRYPDAAALAADLRRFREGKPILARPVGRVEQAWRWCRRNRAVASLLATVLLVFAAGAAVAAYFAMQEAKRAEESDGHARRASDREKDANDERERIRRLLYISQMNQISVAFNDGRIARVLELLRETTPQDGEPDLRGWEWHYFDRATRPTGRSFTLTSDGEELPAGRVLSADGRRLVQDWQVEPSGYVLHVWDTATGTRLPHPIPSGKTTVPVFSRDNLSAPVISPDGKFVGVLCVKETQGGTEGEILPAGIHNTDVDQYHFRIWDVDSGKELADPPIPVHAPLESPDGEKTSSLVIGENGAWASWLERENEVHPLGFGWRLRVMEEQFFGRQNGKLVPVRATTLRRAMWDRATGQVKYTRFQPGDTEAKQEVVGNPLPKPGRSGVRSGPAHMVLAAVSPSGIAVLTTAHMRMNLRLNSISDAERHDGRPRTEGWDLKSDPPKRLWSLDVEASIAVVSPTGNCAAIQTEPMFGTPSAHVVAPVRPRKFGGGPAQPDVWRAQVVNLALECGPAPIRLAGISDGGLVALTRPNTLGRVR